MKRETNRHPKLLDLASRLHCSRPEALGFLTLLFDFTADVAIAGNIGRWPNGAIAGGCDWRGDADEFVAALIGAGWLDEDAEHRLVVHHWGQHCENWVRAKCQKLGITLLGCKTEPQPTQIGTQEPDLSPGPKSGSFSRDRTKPIQTEPTPASTNADWQAAEAELSNLGMGDVSGTITLASGKQYRPEDVLSLIAHYRANPGRWKPGAIRWRIEHSPPSRAVDEGWPPAAESPKKPPSDIERLESTYGIRVGHMTATELNAAMQRAEIPVTDTNVAACRESRSPIRAQLLAQLARDAASSRAPPVEPTTKREQPTHGNESAALRSSQSL